MRKETSGFSEASVSTRLEREVILTTFGSILAVSGRGSAALYTLINRARTEQWEHPVRVTFLVADITVPHGLVTTAVFGSTAGPVSTRPDKWAISAIYGNSAGANGHGSPVRPSGAKIPCPVREAWPPQATPRGTDTARQLGRTQLET